MLKTLFARLKSIEHVLGERLGSDISTPAARRRALLHYHLLDHGIFRTVWTNISEVVPGVWRSNQPSPHQLRRLQKMGIRTVVNLRGVNDTSPYLFEQQACQRLGLKLVSISLGARTLAKREDFLALLDQFDVLERPFIMHCKSGADRAGLASALYLLHVHNVSITKAKKQLSLKFLHVRFFRTGILDYLLSRYEADIVDKPMPIRQWLQTRYRRKELTAEYDKERARR